MSRSRFITKHPVRDPEDPELLAISVYQDLLLPIVYLVEHRPHEVIMEAHYQAPGVMHKARQMMTNHEWDFTRVDGRRPVDMLVNECARRIENGLLEHENTARAFTPGAPT